ncbi:MAG: hypothetical protein QM820_19275 [Minicystis sp.]
MDGVAPGLRPGDEVALRVARDHRRALGRGAEGDRLILGRRQTLARALEPGGAERGPAAHEQVIQPGEADEHVPAVELLLDPFVEQMKTRIEGADDLGDVLGGVPVPEIGNRDPAVRRARELRRADRLGLRIGRRDVHRRGVDGRERGGEADGVERRTIAPGRDDARAGADDARPRARGRAHAAGIQDRAIGPDARRAGRGRAGLGPQRDEARIHPR